VVISQRETKQEHKTMAYKVSKDLPLIEPLVVGPKLFSFLIFYYFLLIFSYVTTRRLKVSTKELNFTPMVETKNATVAC
jgi:hypothetical protein